MSTDLYLALIVTVLVILTMAAWWRHWRLTAPAVYVSGREVESYPGLLDDPADTGFRHTEVVVASPAPLRVVTSLYTIRLAGEDDPRVFLDRYDKAKAALTDAGIDQATFMLKLIPRNATLPPGRPEPLFVLAHPALRRLTQLEVRLWLADPTGRVLVKHVSALPAQEMSRPVTAAERAAQ